MTGCYHCGSDEHFSRNCPQSQPPVKTTTTGLPDWCGQCDPTTRLIDHGDHMRRCPQCHPKRHQTLPQHRRCGGCRRLIYTHDASKCGTHRQLTHTRTR